jgi:fimbrial chaperone protein
MSAISALIACGAAGGGLSSTPSKPGNVGPGFFLQGSEIFGDFRMVFLQVPLGTFFSSWIRNNGKHEALHMTRLIMIVLAALILVFPTIALAGSFKSIPVRLFIEAGSKTEVLKIVNEGDEKVTVQIDVKSWRQDETGKDIYEETNDIVIFPKMANIEKGEMRIIRLGYTGKLEWREKTYRLFMQELPVTKAGEMALKFALTLSIPIFITPEEDIKNWTAEPAGLSKEILKVKVKNSGNRHIMVSKIKAVGFDEAGAEVFTREVVGWYTLAGRSRVYPVEIPQEECLKIRMIKVEAAIEKAMREFSLDVNKEMCTPKGEEFKR